MRQATLIQRLVVMVATFVACDSSGTGPVAGDQLSERIETATVVYQFARGDAVDTATQEAHYRWVKAELAVDPAVKLDYRKYRDRAHLQRLTGRATNGFAEPGTPRFHTIWPWDNHESVHALVILTLGHPPALFNEGVAVAPQTNPRLGDTVARWNGEPVHTIAARLDAAGQLPALDALLTSPSFFSHPESVTYPVAGSWVRYLIDERGLPMFKAYLASSSFEASAAQTRAAFAAAYGVTLDSEWARWRIFLDGL